LITRIIFGDEYRSILIVIVSLMSWLYKHRQKTKQKNSTKIFIKLDKSARRLIFLVFSAISSDQIRSKLLIASIVCHLQSALDRGGVCGI
jgi:hypothetical protein